MSSEEIASSDALLREIAVLHAKWRAACEEAQSERDARLAAEADAAALQTDHARIADDVAGAHRRIGTQGRYTADYRQGAVDAALHIAHLIRKHEPSDHPGAALLAELEAARALAAKINDRRYWRCNICPTCGFGTKIDGSEFHGTGCVLAAYNEATKARSG